MQRLGVSVAMVILLGAGQALAAAPVVRLTSVDGPVLVNQGAGFTPVTDSTILRPGDRLLSRRGAHARLIYANGCVVTLKADALLTVADSVHGASCKGAGVQVADTDLTGDQAQAAPAAAGAAGGAGGAGAAAGATAAAAGATGAGVAGGLSGLAIAGIGAGAVGAGVGVAAATGAIGATTSD